LAEEAPVPDEYETPALMAEGLIIFPNMEVVVTVNDSRNRAALEAARREKGLVVSAPASKSGGVTGEIGVLVHLQESLSEHGGGARVRLRGLWRVHLERVIDGEEYTRVRFAKAEEVAHSDQSTRPEVMRKVLDQIDEFVRLIPGIPTGIVGMLRDAGTPGELADFCAYSPQFTEEERLDLLRTLDPEQRLLKISRMFERQLTALRNATEIKTIPECDTCADLADQAIESEPSQRAEHMSAFLTHVVSEHPAELLALLAEKYGPGFMSKRALK
jgi:ATP-dependent Lon protease